MNGNEVPSWESLPMSGNDGVARIRRTTLAMERQRGRLPLF